MDYRAIAESISERVRPQSHVLGVKLLEERVPEKGFIRPSRYGIRISLCQWTTLARRWRRNVMVLAEDVNCSPCLAAFGFKKMEDAGVLATYFMQMGFFEDPAVADKAVEAIGPLPAGDIRGVAMFPLEDAPMDPDVILVYGSPAQMARLAAGYIAATGELIHSTTAFGLSCLSAVKPHWTGKASFVHPGRGERVLAGTDEGEMCFTLPASQLEALAQGLEKTHQSGTRYPVQSYLLYEPPLLEAMKNLDEKLKPVE